MLEIAALQTDIALVIVALHGELDLASAGPLSTLLADQLSLGHRHVQLDLSGVSFMDASGLDAVVRAHHAFRAQHGRLLLTGIGDRIALLLALTQLDALL